MAAKPGDDMTSTSDPPPMRIEGDILVLRMHGLMEVREMQQLIDTGERLFVQYGYILILGDAKHSAGLSADSRKLQAERLKRFIRPSHTAIYHVNAVARMMTGLAQRGVELLTGKTYPVSFHKDEAEARAELDRQRVILRQAAPKPG
jgi:hypothetical protein